MDSMSFHRKQVYKLLTSSPLKKDMLEYSWCHIVPWEEGMRQYTFLINWKDPSKGESVWPYVNFHLTCATWIPLS
jgi:hypothetical protein